MIGAIPPLPQYAFMAWCLVKAQGRYLTGEWPKVVAALRIADSVVRFREFLAAMVSLVPETSWGLFAVNPYVPYWHL